MSVLPFIILGFLAAPWPWIASAFTAFLLFDIFVGVTLAQKFGPVETGGGMTAVHITCLALWGAIIRTVGLGIGLLLGLAWQNLISSGF